MTDHDRAEIDKFVLYRGYKIELKKDFSSKGFLIDGFFTTYGFVVCDGIVNVMPGAVWFQTVRDAKRAVDDLIEAKKLEIDFWKFREMRKDFEKDFALYNSIMIRAAKSQKERLKND